MASLGSSRVLGTALRVPPLNCSNRSLSARANAGVVPVSSILSFSSHTCRIFRTPHRRGLASANILVNQHSVGVSVGSGSRVHVLTACNEYRQETLVLERSAKRGGYRFRAVGVGSTWEGLGQKLALYDQALDSFLRNGELQPEDPVLVVDAWDTVILGDADELVEKLISLNALGSSSNGLVVGAADRLCAPEYRLAPRMERLYPELKTPWRYPNSGGFAGTASAVAALMRFLVRGDLGGRFTPEGDDQLRLQAFLLACEEKGLRFPFLIDSDCTIFQCMGEPECGWDFETSDVDWSVSPRICNSTTGQKPIVAHGCGGHGRWFLAEVYRRLAILEWLGLDQNDLEQFQYAGLVRPGEQVSDEHWLNQCPWHFPFEMFRVIRMDALRTAEADANFNVEEFLHRVRNQQLFAAQRQREGA